MRPPEGLPLPLFLVLLVVLPIPLGGYRAQAWRETGAQLEADGGASMTTPAATTTRTTTVATAGRSTTARAGTTQTTAVLKINTRPTSTTTTTTQVNERELFVRRRAFDRFMDAVNSKDLGVFRKMAPRFKEHTEALPTFNQAEATACSDALWLPPPAKHHKGIHLVSSKEQCAAVCAMAIPAVVEHARSNPTARDTLSQVLSINQCFWNSSCTHTSSTSSTHTSSTSFTRSCTGFRFDDNGCFLFRTSCRHLGNSLSTLRLPAAAVFCANHLNSTRWWSTGDNTDLVKKCQQGLSGHDVCRQECEALVARMREVAMLRPTQSEIVKIRRENHELNKTTTQQQSSEVSEPNLLSPITNELGLADLCLSQVVKLVESKHLTCCAAGCGWDPARKVCAGASLLSPAALGGWWAECCQINSMLVPSDRQRMCDSARPALEAFANESPEGLPASGALPSRNEMEAFQFGEDLFDPEAGAVEPVNTKQGAALVEFGQAPNIGQVDNTSGTSGTSGTFAVCHLPCKQPWALEASLFQCSNAQLQEWFAPSSPLTCGSALSSLLTTSPGECSEKAPASVMYASWKLTSGAPNAQHPDPQKIEGECRYFSHTCARNWVRMSQNPKTRMDNITAVLWKAFKRT